MRPKKNKYHNNAKISERKSREIFKYFSMDLTAEMTSKLTGISRVTVNKYFFKIRERLMEETMNGRNIKGIIEVDECYKGPKRVKGKRGRGAGGKIKVFGILERGGKVYTEIVPDCSRKILQDIIKAKVDPDSTINSDGWKAYDGLVDIGYKKHHRVIHSKNEFARGTRHINGIESFWSYTKRRLDKFNGLQEKYFLMHLKECEFRWNVRTTGKKLYKVLGVRLL